MKTITLIGLFVVCLKFMASGQLPNEKRNYPTVKVTESPVIDGILNENCWQNTLWEGDFVQHEPFEGKLPSQQTQFAVVYDNDYIYVGIKAWEASTDSIVKRMTRRDEIDGDLVGIQFDSYYDLRTAFTFLVSAAGVKQDMLTTNDGDSEDPTWDPIWFVKTSADTKGWYAEMKIPLTQLRFSQKENQVWGMQVARSLFRKNELSIWQPISRDAGGWVHNIGLLTGLQNLEPKRQLDIIPFITTGVEKYQQEKNNPFATGTDFKYNFGVDSKIGITNNLTLDLSINPDFGQVEADPSQVNLTAFETFFEEKRPFFIEGRNITSFAVMFGDGDLAAQNLFYSRRIGRRPHYEPSLNDFEYAKMPDFSTILAAAKLTGRTENGWSIGILESITQEEKAEIDFEGKRKFETVEPFTNYFTTRIQRDIKDGNTIFGGIITSVNRDINADNLNFLPKSAVTGGLDFQQYFKKKTWNIKVKIMGSQVKGDSTAIQELQLSSSRYFQRPDADYVNYNPKLTTFSGYSTTLEIGKVGGGKFRFLNAITAKSPGFEINDMGYMPNVDEIMHVFWMGYRIYEPFGVFRNLNFNLNEWNGWDFGGNRIYNGGNINVHTQLTNYWYLSWGANVQANSVSNDFLRGGEAMKTPGNANTWIYVGTNDQKKLVFGLQAVYSKGFNNFSNETDLSLDITYRPISTLKITLSPGISNSTRQLQYIDNVNYNTNNRYIFSEINQNTLNLSLRVNYNITPDLSIQYWGQPFIAAGAYNKYKYITNARATEYENRFQSYSDNQILWDAVNSQYRVDENFDGTTDYSIDYPDFNFKEFLSNLVVRWEYKPGSTLYFVWSQTRNHFKDNGSFNIADNTHDLFYTVPQNVILLKFTYRIGV